MPEGKPTDTSRGLSISVPQLIASVLASVSAAILASFFGVAGTLVGTALGSLVATLGTALYLHSINRTTSLLRQQRELLAIGSHRPSRSQERSAGSDQPADRPPSGEPRQPWLARLGLDRGRRLGWKAGLGVAVAVFIVAIGVVTAIEKAASAPLSQVVGGADRSGGTTVGAVFSGGSQPENGTSSTTSTTSESPTTTIPQTSPSPTTTTTTTPTTEPATTTTTSTPPGASSTPPDTSSAPTDPADQSSPGP